MSLNQFVERHIGPRDHEVPSMLETIGSDSLESFVNSVIPSQIRMDSPLSIPDGMTEQEYVVKIQSIGNKNKVYVI